MITGKPYPKYGTRRSYRQFCLGPMDLFNGQSAWLEWVEVTEEYTRGRIGDFWYVVSIKREKTGEIFKH